VAYEGFSVTSVTAGDFDFYGIRDFSRRAGIIKIQCGYLQVGMPPTGEVIVHIPSRDETGESTGQLVITLVVDNWELLLDTRAGKGTLFTYEGYLVMNESDCRIEFEPPEGELVKVVDLV
jgi:hypothetical protein